MQSDYFRSKRMKALICTLFLGSTFALGCSPNKDKIDNARKLYKASQCERYPDVMKAIDEYRPYIKDIAQDLDLGHEATQDAEELIEEYLIEKLKDEKSVNKAYDINLDGKGSLIGLPNKDEIMGGAIEKGREVIDKSRDTHWYCEDTFDKEESGVDLGNDAHTQPIDIDKGYENSQIF